MTKTKKPPTAEDLTRKLQCPGCTVGGDLDCGNYRKGPHDQCVGHSCGTILSGAGVIALGFPKGFCRPGIVLDQPGAFGPIQTTKMQTWSTVSGVKLEVWPHDDSSWDHLNVPVARTVWRGKLAVITYAPRQGRVAVILPGKPLEEEAAKAVAAAIPLKDVLDPAGPTPERLVGMNHKRPFAVRFWTNGERPTYPDDSLRAVWALERDGLLFVRVCRPETAETWVDVVAGASREKLVPQALNAETFYREID